jgi:L-ascorbate metabolism protein UlaG (beta-lactamase superfamily)
MIIKWLGHASFLLKTLGKNFYFDPYAGDYVEPADVILITHNHRDHCALDKIQAIRQDDTLIITNLDCSVDLDGTVVSMVPGDIKELYGVEVMAVASYNYKRFRSPGVPFHPKGMQIGFIVSAEGKRVYHAGDTDFIPEMRDIRDLDVALLPIMGRATMDLNEAVEAALALHPKIVIPMHRRGASAEEFKDKVEATSEVKVLPIEEGDEVNL